jgi:hypothetical protein
MRLTDLDPQRQTFSLVQSPGMGKADGGSCLAQPTSTDVQFDMNGDASVHQCNPASGWSIAGGIENATFEAMTVTPSIDGRAALARLHHSAAFF